MGEKMILSCNTVLFRKYPLEEALEAVREAGFEYIETQAMIPFCPHVNVDTDDPVRFSEKVASFGIKGVLALWMANGRIIAEAESVEKGLRTLEWCKAAGIPNMHTGDGMKPEGMDDEEAFRILRERLLRMIEGAEKNGVTIDIEPHGTFSLSGRGLKRILSISGSPRFGVNYDAANIYRAFFIENIQGDTFKRGSNAGTGEGQGDDEVEVLRDILPRVKFYHAKDIKNGVCQALGEGNVKNDECIKLLKEAGYKGAVSLETDGSNTKEIEIGMAKKSIEYLRKRIL
jgi:sugar phosphate isomerase/epimerase